MRPSTLSDDELSEPPDEILELPPAPSRMTEDEFVDWVWSQEKVRAEWVDGEVILMAPASARHVIVFGWLYHVLDVFVQERGLGLVMGSEFTARLTSRKRTSRRLPDLMFVAQDRMHLVLNNHLEGPPDLAIEIVSPDSKKRDWIEKLDDYEAAGIREYWIVDPLAQCFEAFHLSPEGKFISFYDQPAGLFASRIVTGFQMQIEWLWAEKLPTVLSVLRGLGIIA